MINKVPSDYFFYAADFLDRKVKPCFDFHIHTSYADGKATVGQVVTKAIEKKLEAIAFTEHTEIWHHKTDKEWFTKYKNDIFQIREKYSDKIDIFLAVEAPIITYDGDLELTQDMRDNTDFILSAVHRYPSLGNKKVRELTKSEAIDSEYRGLMSCIESSDTDILAHIGATCSKYVAPFPSNLIRDIIRQAVQANIVVEINPVYHTPIIEFLEMCAEENAKISFGSNAHGFNDIGYAVDKINKELKF